LIAPEDAVLNDAGHARLAGMLPADSAAETTGRAAAGIGLQAPGVRGTDAKADAISGVTAAVPSNGNDVNHQLRYRS
jgi:hypothetical protein